MSLDLIREIVSDDRVRFKDERVNLDLTYITPNILAMGFPASGVDILWRNSIGTVCELLNERHGRFSFMVFNLSEREYNSETFNNQIVHTAFADHHPPSLVRYFEIIRMVDSWLNADNKNVASVHCVGGKGRTGTVIVGVLYYSGKYLDMDSCIQFFARKRSHKNKGIEQPSQIRYALYFERFMNKELLNRNPICLEKIIFSGLSPGNRYSFEIWSSPFKGNLIYREIFDYKPQDSKILIFNLKLLDLRGDIYIIVYQKKPISVDFSKLFHVCYHTFFIKDKHIVVTKNELDDVDKSLPNDFTLAITFIQTSINDIIEIPDFMTQMFEIYHKRKSTGINALGISSSGLSMLTVNNTKFKLKSSNEESSVSKLVPARPSIPAPPSPHVQYPSNHQRVSPNIPVSPHDDPVPLEQNSINEKSESSPIKNGELRRYVRPLPLPIVLSNLPTKISPLKPSSLSSEQKATLETMLGKKNNSAKT